MSKPDVTYSSTQIAPRVFINAMTTVTLEDGSEWKFVGRMTKKSAVAQARMHQARGW